MAVNHSKLEKLLQTLPGAVRYAESVCEEIIVEAKNIFVASEVKGNEKEVSQTSPPKYLDSFGWRKDPDGWVVFNDDPGAIFVEFGAHAGGETPVLKYAPMRKALDVVIERRNHE